MSSRRPAPVANVEAVRLRAELQSLKQQNIQAEAAGTAAQEGLSTPTTKDGVPAFDQLSGTEQAAGSLGVHPQAWKPIKFMNNAHFNSLMKSNALDDTLARRIEAFRAVATAQ